MKLEILAGIAALATSVAAGTDYIGASCLTVAQTYNYTCAVAASTSKKAKKGHGGATASPKCLCKQPAFIETLVGCSVLYRKDTKMDPADMHFPLIDEFCGKHVDAEQYVSTVDSLKPLKGNPKRAVIKDNGILLNRTAVEQQAAASQTSDRMNYYNYAFAGAPVAYFFGIFLIKGFFNFMQMAAPQTYQSLITLSVSRKLRKYVLLPATGRKTHSASAGPKWFPFQMPQRIESLIVLGYVIFSVITDFVCIWPYYPNTRLTDDFSQWAKFIGRRSGYVSLGAYDLLLLFAGRNNFWMWITGWPLDTFNMYHRWAGRVATFHIMVHSIAYGVLGIKNLAAPFMVWGIAGTILFCLLIIHSSKVFRNMAYETFFVIHIVLAVFAMPATWIHIRNSGIQFCYAGVAIWVFDHVVRIIRIIVSGVTSKAQVKLVNDEILRLELDYSRAWKWYPGCYVFVHLANRPLEFWQSHPFTALPMTDPVSGKDKIVLCARVRRGLTKKLARELVSSTTTLSKQIPVLIDGPYGHKAPVHQYNTAVLIGGGIGITAPLAYALELVGKQSSKTERILLVWALRSHQGTSYVQSELDKVRQDPRVEIQIFVTSEEGSALSTPLTTSPKSSQPSSDVESAVITMTEKSKEVMPMNEKSKEVVSVKSDSSGYSFHRPDLHAIISHEVNSARGSVAVMVCGPGPMNDDVRAAVVSNVDSGVKLDYFEEAFAW